MWGISLKFMWEAAMTLFIGHNNFSSLAREAMFSVKEAQNVASESKHSSVLGKESQTN